MVVVAVLGGLEQGRVASNLDLGDRGLGHVVTVDGKAYLDPSLQNLEELSTCSIPVSSQPRRCGAYTTGLSGLHTGLSITL